MTNTPKMTKEEEDAFVRRVLEERAAERAAAQTAANAEQLAKLQPVIPALVDAEPIKLPDLIDVLDGLIGDRDTIAATHAQAAKLSLERLSDHLTQRVQTLGAEVVVAPSAELLAAQ